MRKLLIVFILLIVFGVLEVRFTGSSVLSSLPPGWIPESWIETVSNAFPDYFRPSVVEESATIRIAEPRVPLHKPLSELTEEEIEIKARLEQQLMSEMPSDVIVKRNGRRLEGTIIEQTASQVRLQQDFRGAGTMSTWIPRSSIRTVIRAQRYLPVVSYRDVRYQMEFPKLGLYLRPPFSVMTGKNFLDVESAVNLLDGLNSQVQHQFQDVMQESERESNIQLLFFSEEREFESYRDKFANHLGYSVGFYSPQKDRLVIYDQQTSDEKAKIESRLDTVKASYQERHSSQRHQNAATRWNQEKKRELSAWVAESNQRILRHEGAHQLFSAYGVHSAHGAEHLWLIEGLAVYCESKSFGARPDHLMEGVRPGLLSFPRLVDFSGPRGFGALGTEKTVGVAYAMSGLMAYVLMQPEYRSKFFAYIELLQDPDSAARIRETSRFDFLSQTLEVTPQQFEQRLVAELHRAI